jgi:hypothetical protein
MSESFAPATTLSPDFERARKLSRVMAVLFTIAFWLTLAGTMLLLGLPLDPLLERGGVGHGIVGFYDIKVSLEGLSVLQCVWVMLAFEMATLPVLFLLHHARLVFGHFAKGEIFVLPVIDHIRSAGLWLIISFFAPMLAQMALNLLQLSQGQAHGSTWPLTIGAVTFIAASVMAEARRIADDNASIV